MTVLLALTMAMGGLVHADLTPRQVNVAKKCIEGLGSKRAEIRERAARMLVGLGPEVVSVVKKTGKETDNAEVKAGCQRVLKIIGETRWLQVKLVKCLGAVPPEAAKTGKGILISENGEHIAYVVKREGKSAVMYDGKEGPEYEDIRGLMLSRDGRRTAYVAERWRKYVVVADGKESRAYEKVPKYLVFSPDGQHLAYVAEHDGRVGEGEPPVYDQDKSSKKFIVLDGKAGEVLENRIEYLVFSPDGTRLACTVTRFQIHPESSRKCIMVDGKKGREYAQAWGAVFSPTSERLAYLVRRGQK